MSEQQVSRRSSTARAGLPAYRPDPWARQLEESDPAWEAFRIYRELQPPRRTSEVARQLGKSQALISRWLTRHHWAERVLAWENELDRELRATMAAERREVIRRHIRVARLAQAKALERLTRIDASTLAPSEVIRLLEYASKAERELYGLSESEEEGRVAVQIVIDPRLLPTGFRTADTEDVTDRRLVIDAAPDDSLPL